MQAFTEWIGHIEADEPVQVAWLEFVPLLGHNVTLHVADLLHAPSEDEVRISELPEGPRVNLVEVLNHLTVPLVLLDGQELRGAHQDRIVNASILLPPGKPTRVPVSCVEAGRWGGRSRRFESSGAMPASLRMRKSSRVHHSLERTSSDYDAGQGAVWDDVRDYAERRGVSSRTQALRDSLDHRQPPHPDDGPSPEPPDASRVQHKPRQIGLAVRHEGVLLAIDLFGSEQLCAAALPRLVASWIRSDPPERRPQSDSDPVRVMRAIFSAPGTEHEPPGLGVDLRTRIPGWRGSALLHDGQPVHASALPDLWEAKPRERQRPRRPTPPSNPRGPSRQDRGPQNTGSHDPRSRGPGGAALQEALDLFRDSDERVPSAAPPTKPARTRKGKSKREKEKVS